MEGNFSLQDLKQTRFYQEAKEEGRQQAREEARQQAREEARQQGLLEAKLKILLRLLQFGLTAEQIAQVLNLEVAQVEQAAQQANNQTDESRED